MVRLDWFDHWSDTDSALVVSYGMRILLLPPLLHSLLALTAGMSSQKMAISEIGVSCPDDTFGDESRFGVPFTVSPSVHVHSAVSFHYR